MKGVAFAGAGAVVAAVITALSAAVTAAEAGQETVPEAGADSGSAQIEPAPETLRVTASRESFSAMGDGPDFPLGVTVDGPEGPVALEALGSGVRTKMTFRVYEIAAYAEKGALRGEGAYPALVEGEFVKRLVLRFQREVHSGHVRALFERGLRKSLGKPWPPDLAEATETFLRLVERTMQGQETIELTWVPGWGLYTVVAGEPRPRIPDPAFPVAVWGIWFGTRPVNEGLKRDLLRLGENGSGD